MQSLFQVYLQITLYYHNKQTDIETFLHTEINIDINIGFHRDKTCIAPMMQFNQVHSTPNFMN